MPMVKKTKGEIIIRIIDWTLLTIIIVTLIVMIYKGNFNCTQVVMDCPTTAQTRMEITQQLINGTLRIRG